MDIAHDCAAGKVTIAPRSQVSYDKGSAVSNRQMKASAGSEAGLEHGGDPTHCADKAAQSPGPCGKNGDGKAELATPLGAGLAA